MTNLAPTAHSKLGASSMYRWAACPGSVKLSEGIVSPPSKYAEEGTKAHEVAASRLQKGYYPLDTPSEMEDAVEVYVQTVLAEWKEAQTPSDKLLIEHQFDLSTVHPGCFGTADCVMYKAGQKLLKVFDYKHGQGIPVAVIEDGKPNVQLSYYGLGALLSTGFPCDEVELVIVQPRCSHPDGTIRRVRFKSIDLLDFAADVADFARATEKPNALIVPGGHCRFCPAATICPQIHQKAQALAKEQFRNDLSYDPVRLAEILNWLPALEGWAKSVREFAYAEAEHGRCPPGWKLVAKRATRKWLNAEEAAETLREEFGLTAAQLFEATLRSPAQVEKMLKNKAEKEKLAALVAAVSSGDTLVPDEDPRQPSKLDAKSQFNAILE